MRHHAVILGALTCIGRRRESASAWRCALDEQAAVAEALDEQLAGKPMKFQARHLEVILQSSDMHVFVCQKNLC